MSQTEATPAQNPTELADCTSILECAAWAQRNHRIVNLGVPEYTSGIACVIRGVLRDGVLVQQVISADQRGDRWRAASSLITAYPRESISFLGIQDRTFTD